MDEAGATTARPAPGVRAWKTDVRSARTEKTYPVYVMSLMRERLRRASISMRCLRRLARACEAKTSHALSVDHRRR